MTTPPRITLRTGSWRAARIRTASQPYKRLTVALLGSHAKCWLVASETGFPIETNLRRLVLVDGEVRTPAALVGSLFGAHSNQVRRSFTSPLAQALARASRHSWKLVAVAMKTPAFSPKRTMGLEPTTLGLGSRCSTS